MHELVLQGFVGKHTVRICKVGVEYVSVWEATHKCLPPVVYLSIHSLSTHQSGIRCLVGTDIVGARAKRGSCKGYLPRVQSKMCRGWRFAMITA